MHAEGVHDAVYRPPRCIEHVIGFARRECRWRERRSFCEAVIETEQCIEDIAHFRRFELREHKATEKCENVCVRIECGQ